jgi:hypothetical protein
MSSQSGDVSFPQPCAPLYVGIAATDLVVRIRLLGPDAKVWLPSSATIAHLLDRITQLFPKSVIHGDRKHRMGLMTMTPPIVNLHCLNDATKLSALGIQGNVSLDCMYYDWSGCHLPDTMPVCKCCSRHESLVEVGFTITLKCESMMVVHVAKVHPDTEVRAYIANEAAALEDEIPQHMWIPGGAYALLPRDKPTSMDLLSLPPSQTFRQLEILRCWEIGLFLRRITNDH